jgi:hypothetical protein
MQTSGALDMALLLTIALLTAAPAAGDGLPDAPDDVAVRVVAALGADEQEPVRIAAHPDNGLLYVLGGGGDVTLLDPRTGRGRRVLTGSDYIADQPARRDVNIPLPVDAKLVNSPIALRATLCLGLAFDRDRRLLIAANVQVPGPVLINRVDLYRTPPIGGDGLPQTPTLWTRFAHPYGVGGFNHGACRIAQGPDGGIYLGVGSRTDHGEAGDDPHIGRLGEGPDPAVPAGPGLPPGAFTACILRFDPARGQQAPEVYSRGNRNPFGFDWDDEGRLLDAEHGPMVDHPEELNLIERGKHYGFPHVFGNGETPNYPDRVPPPPGLRFEPPVENLGPAGLLGTNSLFSLAPHSAPGGLIFYRAGGLPARYERSFFLARFGNLVGYNRIGFDVLNVRLERQGDRRVARTERFLDHLGRPIDLCFSGGRLYVVEYGRQKETVGPGAAGYGVGGRVLEVGAKP